MRNAGATPKLTTSERESSCTPSSLLDFVNLAINPSSASKIAAIKISHAAYLNLPWLALMMDKNPANIFIAVKRFGTTERGMRGMFIFIFS